MKTVGVHHVSINVDDLEAARAFYVDRLGLTERTDRPDLDDALWSIVSRAGAMSARKLKPFGIEVRRPEGAAVVLRNAEKVAVLTGHPSEIALYLFGRRGAADVQISGDAEATAKLRQAQLGI